MADSKEQQPLDIDELLKELTFKIERVKQLYEQYFMGIEKIEPLTARKEVQRTMIALQQTHIRNTGLRFKFNTMLQKWNIYITYWNRILREIENGTYSRHVAKAQRVAEREGKVLPEEMRLKQRAPAPETIDTGARPQRHFLDRDSDAHAIAPSKPTDEQIDPGLERVPPARPRAPTPLPSVPGMSEQDLRALHAKFLQSRKQAGESANVSYETLVNSLAKQVGKVLEQPGIRGVRFDVAVQNGKTILKAIPQKAPTIKK